MSHLLIARGSLLSPTRLVERYTCPVPHLPGLLHVLTILVMRCGFSCSGAQSFTRPGHNRPYRSQLQLQPQTAHRYRGSLTHLRDLARLDPRPSLCIHQTHHHSFSHTTDPAAQSQQWSRIQYRQSAIHTIELPPVLC
jgi:hypothetical protein